MHINKSGTIATHTTHLNHTNSHSHLDTHIQLRTRAAAEMLFSALYAQTVNNTEIRKHNRKQNRTIFFSSCWFFNWLKTQMCFNCSIVQKSSSNSIVWMLFFLLLDSLFISPSFFCFLCLLSLLFLRSLFFNEFYLISELYSKQICAAPNMQIYEIFCGFFALSFI